MRRWSITVVPVAFVAGISLAGADDTTRTAGSIQGRVLFDGGQRPPKGVTFADIVVWLVGKELRAATRGDVAAPATDTVAPASSAVAVLDQKNITFVPHVLPVLVGSTVEIRNSDKILHNIHTQPASNDSMNQASRPGGAVRVTYTKPEIIHVGCDMHSQMSAFVVVLENPFFTKPGKDGRYTIASVPPGKYKLHVWHEKFGKLKQDVEVVAGKATELDVSFSGSGK